MIKSIISYHFIRWSKKFRLLHSDFQSKTRKEHEEALFLHIGCRLSKENNISEGEHLSALQQLTAENEALARSHREQLREREEEFREQTSSLQAQIEMAEAENERLQLQMQQLQAKLDHQQQQLLVLKEHRTEHSSRAMVGDSELWVIRVLCFLVFSESDRSLRFLKLWLRNEKIGDVMLLF